MKTLRNLMVLFVMVSISTAFVGCSSDDDETPSDYASKVAGVYTGKLTVNGTIVEDAYVVAITKISSTVVSVSAEFYNEGIRNYNVNYSNGQYLLTSETSTNINISITGKSMTISFLNNNGSITNFNGTKD